MDDTIDTARHISSAIDIPVSQPTCAFPSSSLPPIADHYHDVTS